MAISYSADEYDRNSNRAAGMEGWTAILRGYILLATDCDGRTGCADFCG